MYGEALERLLKLGDGLGDTEAFGAFCRELKRRGGGEPDEALTRVVMGEPSAQGWAQIVERVDVLAEGEGVERAHGAAVAADALMGHWPDELRRAPMAWLAKVIEGGRASLAQVAPGWGLVRVIAPTCWDAMDASRDGYFPAYFETFERYAVMRLFYRGALAPLVSLGLDALYLRDIYDASDAYAGPNQLRWAKTLRHLSLWYEDGCDDLAFAGVLEALASGPLYKRPLQTLSLRGVFAAADQIVDWIESAGWNNTLETLSLEAVGLDDGSFGRLMSLPWPRLVHLSVPRNALGDVSAFALARAGWIAHLKTLDLSENGVGDAGALALLARADWTALQMLNLGGPALGAAAVERLSREPKSAPVYCYQLLQSRGEARYYDPANENYLSVPLWSDAGKTILHRNWDIYDDAFHRRYEDHDAYEGDDGWSDWDNWDALDLAPALFSRAKTHRKRPFRGASKGFFVRLKPLAEAHAAIARAWIAPHKSMLVPFEGLTFGTLEYRIDQWLETLTCGPFYVRRDRTYAHWAYLMDVMALVRPWTPLLMPPKPRKYAPRYMRYNRFGMLFGLAYCLEQRLIDPVQVWALLCAPEPPKCPELPSADLMSPNERRHQDWRRLCLSQPAIQDAHTLAQFRTMTQRALATLQKSAATDHPLWIALQQIAPDLCGRVKGWKAVIFAKDC